MNEMTPVDKTLTDQEHDAMLGYDAGRAGRKTHHKDGCGGGPWIVRLWINVGCQNCLWNRVDKKRIP